MPSFVKPLALAALLVASAAFAQTGQPTPIPPGPCPTAAEIAAAVEALKDVYDKDYAVGERLPRARSTLAQKLFDLAPKRKTAGMIFACYDEARRLAAEAGDVKLAVASLDALNRQFTDHAPLMRRDTFKQLAAAELTEIDAITLARLARVDAGVALDQELYDLAGEFATVAATVAKKANDPELALELREYRIKLDAIRKARDTVKVNERDTAANTVLGEFWVFERGNWAAGLKHLATGSDKVLAEIAIRDLALPKTAKERTALGEAWQKLAVNATDMERKRHLIGRAWEWYAAAVAVATGDDDLKPSERAKEIEAEYPALFNAVLEGHTSAVAALAITPDAKRLVSVSNDNSIKVWDAATGKLVRTLEGHTGWVGSVVISPDSTRAYTAGGDALIRVWDIKTGQQVGELEGHTIAVRGLALAAGGKLLVSVASDKTVRLWGTTTGKFIRKFGDETQSLESVAISTDGARIFVGNDVGIITVYDAKDGKTVSEFKKHAGTMVYTIAVTKDGKTAISGARDKVIRVWDVATGKELRTFAGHTEQVYQVLFNADEKLVLSASFDKTARIWDFASGKELKKFDGHTDGVQGVCFGAEGRVVFTASWDKTLRKWRVPPGLAAKKAE